MSERRTWVICFFFVTFAFLCLPRVQSLVITSECPGQGVKALRREAEHFELSLIFYYVSWSSSSLQALHVYDALANFYYEQAYFGAVDCWHLQCNCSQTHQVTHGSGAPHKWPTLIVNYGKKLTLEYRGNWQFEDIARFLNHLIEPIDRLQNSEDIKTLSHSCDAIVLALCDKANSVEYKRFIAAAITWLEVDPERNVRFAVAFDEDARHLVKKDNGTLPLIVFIDAYKNRVNTFNLTGGWGFRDIVRWVQACRKTMYHYVSGYNTPRSVALKLPNGPVLTLSVNQQPYQKYFYTLMSERVGKKDEILKQQHDCDQFWDMEYAFEGVENFRSLLYVDLIMPAELAIKEHSSGKLKLDRFTWANYFRINRYLNYLWTSQAHKTIDEQSGTNGAAHLIELQQRNKCLTQSPLLATSALKIHIAKYLQKTAKKLWHLSSAQLRQNQSLSVVLLETSKHKDFLLQHNIPLDMQSAANVFIVDGEREMVHVMQSAFSHTALLDFIRRFYAGELPALHRSSTLPAPSNANAQYIATYNRQLLMQVLQQQNVTNVVLLHSPTCELCAVMAQSFMQLSLLLSSSDIRFIRLDTLANDLPWELVMPTTPAMIVFPASRAMESRVFPTHLKANVRNLLGFILAQLEPEAQLRLVLASCKRTRHVKRCLEFAKSLVMQHIGQYLKFWEIFETERHSILQHLKQFNDYHIEIESSFRT